MGGCRCTYRNCTVKSDGKTHMFHYPVFEKVRCHQWLINANRLDFLDLKVSQLKNRVVCQHHFKDEAFMNYRKDKLTFDAIPTEDGPFCDPTKFVDRSQELIKSFPTLILLEDIENEVIFNDKKANFSLKYGDFLTNGELTDSSTRYNSNIINLTKENNKTVVKSNITLKALKKIPKPDILMSNLTSLSLHSKTAKKKPKPLSMPTIPPHTDLSFEIEAGKEVNQLLGTINILQSDSTVVNQPTSSRSLLKQHDTTPQKVKTDVKPEPKIKILSEEKIDVPIPVIGKLEKVSPSTTITIPDKSREKSVYAQNNLILTTNKSSDNVKVLEVLDVEYEPLNQLKADTSAAIIQTNTESKVNGSKVTQEKSSKLKIKLTPERSAAIEKKREFNMRMKGILETCLEKLDDPVKVIEENTIPTKISRQSLIKQPILKPPHVKEALQNVQQYTIAYLDERMKSMEKVLLNKIEQNSQKIMELTGSLVSTKKDKESLQKKSVNAQTNQSDEQYKKFLYEEISKYISPDSKSLIYEELFINKFSIDNISPQKKRRRKFL